MRRPFLVPLLTALILSPGCKREEEVRVYQAPKDRLASAAPSAAGAGSPTGATGSSTTSPRPPWTVPDGWTEKPSTGGMRIASYAITSADGRSVDVSVVPLGGQSGSTLDNVNRWRDQVGLGPLTEAELASQRQTVRIGDYDGEFYDLVSEKPMLDGQYKVRTLAAILPLPGTTVFFKATGEDALVRENLAKFKAWLSSVQTGPTSGSAPASASAGAPTPGGVPPDMRGPVAPPPSTALPTWEVPSGWKSAPATTMRLASFVIPGANGQTGDLSVVALGPAAGGALANVNRWRDQLGLPAVDDAGLARSTSTVDVTGGDRALVVELKGEGASAGKGMLAAIVTRPDRTWFYKLTGDDVLIAAERNNFVQFVRSVKYP